MEETPLTEGVQVLQQDDGAVRERGQGLGNGMKWGSLAKIRLSSIRTAF